jgi:hypothetical protein
VTVYALHERQFLSGHTITNVRQLRVLRALIDAGDYGLTSRELAQVESRGDVSGVANWGGAFTILRQQGHIVALQERRESHHVYVMPNRVGDRDTWRGYTHSGGHCATCTCDQRDDDEQE